MRDDDLDHGDHRSTDGIATTPSWPSGWLRATAAVAVALGAVVALYAGTFAEMVGQWNQSEAHRFSFLVVPVSLYFVWLRRHDVARIAPGPAPEALPLAVGFSILWLTARAADVSVAMQVAAVGVVQGMLLAVLGWRAYRALLFPFLFLWLAVPAGESLIPSLMDLTTTLTVAGLHLFGTAATADGTIISAGADHYAIVEECSALDFIIGNLVISLVFANLMFRGISRRALFIAASVPAAIAANIARTTSIILITRYSDGRIDLAADHATYGWLVFCGAVIAFMAVGMIFRDTADDAGRAPVVAEVGARPAPSARRLAATVVALAAAAALGPVYAAVALERQIAPVAVDLCPVGAPGDSVAAGNWQPVFPAAHAIHHRVYDIGGAPVDMFVAFYLRQGPGVELVEWRNRLYDGRTWRILSQATETVRVEGRPLHAVSLRLRGLNRGRRVVWSWYWVDGRLTGSAWLAKLLQAKATLAGGERRAAVIAVSADERGAPDRARAAMAALLERSGFVMTMLRRAHAAAPGRRDPC